jgi:hypothetical protein
MKTLNRYIPQPSSDLNSYAAPHTASWHTLYAALCSHLLKTEDQASYSLPLVEFCEFVLEKGIDGLGHYGWLRSPFNSILGHAMLKTAEAKERTSFSASAIAFAGYICELNWKKDIRIEDLCADLIAFLQLEPEFFAVCRTSTGIQITGTRRCRKELGLKVRLDSRL